MNSQVVTCALLATCLVVALALWPLDVARAAPADGCISGLPADLASQLQPLVQALGEVTDGVMANAPTTTWHGTQRALQPAEVSENATSVDQ